MIMIRVTMLFYYSCLTSVITLFFFDTFLDIASKLIIDIDTFCNIDLILIVAILDNLITVLISKSHLSKPDL